MARRSARQLKKIVPMSEKNDVTHVNKGTAPTRTCNVLEVGAARG